MGTTCCGSKDIKYEFEGKTNTIARKDATTIERFSQGSLARIQTKKMKNNLAKEITDLPYPTVSGRGGAPLLTEKEFSDYMKGDGSTLRWNNYFQQVGGSTDYSEYKGQWTGDGKEWCGIGELKYTDGSLYQGFTKNKMPNGKGRMTKTDGDIIQGNWKNGKVNGYAAFHDVKDAGETSLYEGPWQAGQQHGKGKETWNNGTYIYNGDFVKGQKTGKGKFEFDGSWYEGDFVEGNMHGEGKYYFADTKRTFEGQFVQNEIAGTGRLVGVDGSVYEGGFKNGLRNGQGTHTLANGQYTGGFKDDKYHGAGVWITDTVKRQGEWSNGKRIAWLSQPMPYDNPNAVLKTGTMNSKTGKLYKGMAWKENLLDGMTRDYDLQAVKGGSKNQKKRLGRI